MEYKILVADDEKEIRNLLRLYLENDGFKVIEAENGLEVMDKLESDRPDMCLLDIMMPGMDGLTALKNLRSKSNIPVMMITARTADAERPLGVEAHCPWG